MKKKTIKTTDEEITLSLKKEHTKKSSHTTDEEITIEWMSKGDDITHQPKDYEDIEY
jgi:hypothetical protein